MQHLCFNRIVTMAFYQPNKKIRELDNTGFSANNQNFDTRFLNKDGTSNVIKTGINPLERFSIYHYMLNLATWRFFFFIFLFYSSINFLFAIIYIMVGVNHLHGLVQGSAFQNFEEAYFFSAQTLTTVGYGRISPIGLLANTISSLEALTGIMTLAIITGLLYGRFVNPKAFIAYSKNALIAPFKDGKALMFRLAPTKNSNLSELNATVTITMQVEEDGIYKNQFFPLPLQLDKIMSLALSWTIVHPINEESPLYNLTIDEIIEAKVQVIVFFKAFDEGFSSIVVSRTSYTWHEIIDNAKFNPMFRSSSNGDAILLELDKINDFSKLQER